MNAHELSCARALRGVTFVPTSTPKRFARDMLWIAEHDPERALTERQSMWLSALVWRFRRQIADKALVVAAAVRTGCARYGDRAVAQEDR